MNIGNYKLADTPSGYKTLLFIGSREQRLHSAYDPCKEAERSVNEYKPGRSNLIIVAGIGLGYHIKFLKNRFPERRIIAIEKDPELLSIIKKEYPENINNVSVIFSPDDLPGVFENIDISLIKGVSAYIHRQSYSLYKDFYDLLLNEINKFISSKVSDLLTRFEFEENWIRNIFRNVQYLYSSVPAKSLFGKFTGIPGVIVSAGPSLKKNVKLLNNIKDKALVACVDTAITVLQRHDINPHIVMTLDSQKYSLKHFLGIRKTDTVLLADMVSCPRIIQSYNGLKILSATSKYYTDQNGKRVRETTPVWDWFEKFTGSIGDLQSGGSVATSLFDLLLNLGCSPIILVGQDLAYTGREIHCTGTYHNNEWLPKTSRFYNLESINQNVIRKRKIKYVPGYGNGKEVISDFVFDIYKQWFKDSAGLIGRPDELIGASSEMIGKFAELIGRTVSGIDVINATEGGARIDNTIEKSLSEVISCLGSLQKTPGDILNSNINTASVQKYPVVMLNGIRKAIRDIEKLKSDLSNHQNVFLKEEVILDIAERSNLSKLILPFLRKTFIYISRHPDLSAEKVSGLLQSDLVAAFNKISRLLEACKQNLENIRL